MICGPKLPVHHSHRRRIKAPTKHIDPALRIFYKTPTFTDAVVDPLDSRYFWFFLASMNQIFNYTELFPSIVSDIFSRTLDNVCVKYSVLSISSIIADFRLRRSLERFEVNYIVSLRKIQECIDRNELDEGLAIGVFLIAWIDAVRARMSSCRKHLHGLSLILQQVEPTCRNPSNGRSVTSPFLMLIWRLSVRLDCAVSFYSLQEPVLQMAAGAEDFHRQWVSKVTAAGDATDWALAAFALDSCYQRTLTYGIQVYKLRNAAESSGNSESPELQRKIKSLLGILRVEVNMWRERPIVQHALRSEELAEAVHSPTTPATSTTSPTPLSESICPSEPISGADSDDQFLHYPRMHILNSLFASLLISWRGISILVSLIDQPRIGWRTCPMRFRYAVEICRSLAALGEDRGRTGSYKYFPIFMILVAFGSDSPTEWKWAYDKAKELGVSFPFSRDGYVVFEQLWKSDGNYWEEMAKTNEVTDI